MRPLVHEKPHRVPVDDDFEHKVRRRAGPHGLPHDAVVVWMDQRLIQVQYQDFPFNDA